MKTPPCDLTALAVPGAVLRVRATPGARQPGIACDADGTIRVRVTAPPEGGKANAEIRKLLARALGIAPSRLMLDRGDTARDKLFRVTD